MRNQGSLSGRLNRKDVLLRTRNPAARRGAIIAARPSRSKWAGCPCAGAEENFGESGKRTGGGIIPGPRQAIVRRRSRTEVQAIGW